MCHIVQPTEFETRLAEVLTGVIAKSVTGPGRSGAIASVYASHRLHIPWIPYGQPMPESLRPVLIIDTAAASGATLRKAARRYNSEIAIAVYNEPPRVKFWYEVQSI